MPKSLTLARRVEYSSEYVTTGAAPPFGYTACVRWNIAKKRMELWPSFLPTSTKIYIKFGHRTANPETHRECVHKVVRFIRLYGVKAQWEADNIKDINQRLWIAAIKVWGLPAWSESDND